MIYTLGDLRSYQFITYIPNPRHYNGYNSNFSCLNSAWSLQIRIQLGKMGMNFPLFIFNIRPDYYLNLINVDLKWNKKTKKDETIIFIKKFDL